MSGHSKSDPLLSYILVFFTLMGLLVLTVLAYQIPFEKKYLFGIQLSFMNTAVALTIATIKALLVMIVFMHLRHGSKLLWIIAIAGFIWLGIMAVFTFSDYLSRAAIKESLKEPIPVVHSELPKAIP